MNVFASVTCSYHAPFRSVSTQTHVASRTALSPLPLGSKHVLISCLCSVQSTLLQAVLPLWLHPQLSQLPQLHTPVISILTSCTEGPASSAAAAASRAPAAPPALNPSTVQQIVDMGFSAQRAEAALRRVSAQIARLLINC